MMHEILIGVFIIIYALNEFAVGMIIYCSPETIQAHIFIMYVYELYEKNKT